MQGIKKKLTQPITRNNLEKFVKSNSSDLYTLDIGCSNSRYSKYFSNRVGLDVKKGAGVDVIGDAHHLPFEDNKFDLILCTEVLEHLHSPEVAIKEMQRVLKGEGKIILSTRFLFPIHGAPDDFFRFTRHGLEYLFRDWKRVYIWDEASTGQSLAILLQNIVLQSSGGNKISNSILLLISKLLVIFSSIGLKTGVVTNFTSGYYLMAYK